MTRSFLGLAAAATLAVLPLLACDREPSDGQEAPPAARPETDTDVQEGPRAGRAGDATTDAAPDGLGDRDEEARLLLIQEVPLGLSYSEARERLPGLGPLVPEGPEEVAAEEALGEAALSTRVLGQPARLEFNFQGDSLYSYYYVLGELGCDRALGLYRRLRRFYDERLDRGREEIQREPGYESRSAYWTPDDWSVVATLGLEGEVCRLAWGFQIQEP